MVQPLFARCSQTVCAVTCVHKRMLHWGSSSLNGRILERTPALIQARQLRCFSDVLVYDLTQGSLKTTHTNQQVVWCACVNKYIYGCNKLKFNI